MLKQCQSPQITAYFGSAVVPGTSQLMIVMELLAASAADLVSQVSCCTTSSFDHQRHSQRCVLWAAETYGPPSFVASGRRASRAGEVVHITPVVLPTFCPSRPLATLPKQASLLSHCFRTSRVPRTAALQVSEDTGGEPLPEACIAYVMRQVLLALAYLHGQQRIHRDVKAANILLADDGAVRVSDFGVSAQLGCVCGDDAGVS